MVGFTEIQGIKTLAQRAEQKKRGGISTQQLLAERLLKTSQDRNVNPIARGFAAFFGARNLKAAERETTRQRDERALEDQVSAERLAREVLGEDADPSLIEGVARGGAGALRKILLEQRTRKPTVLKPGDVALSAKGKTFTAPPSELMAAKTRKFAAEARKIEKELASGKPTRDPKIFSDTQDLRKEFTGLSKEFIMQRDAIGRVQASAQDPSAAGDLALIFNFMKILDPGSTVREGEFATAENAAGIPERIRAKWNKAKAGERLTKKSRADFVGRANKLFKRADLQHQQRVKAFTGLAQKSGLPADQVTIDIGLAEQEVAQERTLTQPTEVAPQPELTSRGTRTRPQPDFTFNQETRNFQ